MVTGRAAGALLRRELLARMLLVAALLAAGMAMAQDATPTPAPSSAPAPAPTPAPAPAVIAVVVQTSLGEIRLELEKDKAPLTTANFLHYVDTRRLDGTTFYRALKLDAEGKYGLVQGGLRGNRKRTFKPVAHESPAMTGLRHVNGALSMARSEPGSATADFFITIGELSSLDGKPEGDDPGYAVFGHVTTGMEVVLKMLELPRDAAAGEGVMKGQILAEPVKIISVRRVQEP